jgi:rhodanese-related sulfurtransferase
MSNSPEIQALLDAAQDRGSKQKLPYFGALTPREAHELVSRSSEARIIDVRTKAEWDYVGRIPNTSLIEWQFYPSMSRNPNFVQQLRDAVPDTATPVIFVCRSGVRSHGAAAAAAEAGYRQSFNLLEGFEGNKDGNGHRSSIGGWRAAGLPWVQS